MKNLTGTIHHIMNQNIQQKGFVAPVDVLMDLGVLEKKDFEAWRLGRVPFLEKVCRANLDQLSAMMSEIRACAARDALKPSWTDYHPYGKDRKNKLRFSKSGAEAIEAAYATHYVDVQRISQLKDNTNQGNG
ncbi:MAG: hypothetical protein GX112_03235 [Clostridiaceae bacterium]|jgi:hypothetical protein|nr:hypothetical protein [Clostridiaceae bacterium]